MPSNHLLPQRTNLPNGLRIVTNPMSGRDSVSLGFWVGVGGRHEEDRVKGAAHFLEHIVFKGSQTYSCEEIKMRIEGVGGSLNAFTSEEQTCFFAKIPKAHLAQAFDVLADMVFFPKIAPADVRKESLVIVEEIKMYRDLPQYFVLDLLDELMWPGHPLGKSLAGTVETVSAMSSQDLKGFHRKHYAPENIVISACGNIEHAKLVNLARKKLGQFSAQSNNGYIKAENVQDGPRLKFHPKAIEQMHVVLGVYGYDEFHKDRFALSILNVILGGNMSSRLFETVREKHGLAYSISSSAKMLHDTGLFMVRAGVDNKKIVDAVKLILKELERLKREGVTQDEFTRAKDYALGQLLLSLEDTLEHMLWIGERLLSKNELTTLRKAVLSFKKVTIEDVTRVARDILKSERYNLAVVGPISDRQQKELKGLFKPG